MQSIRSTARMRRPPVHLKPYLNEVIAQSVEYTHGPPFHKVHRMCSTPHASVRSRPPASSPGTNGKDQSLAHFLKPAIEMPPILDV
jgi:hypothetical protein